MNRKQSGQHRGRNSHVTVTVNLKPPHDDTGLPASSKYRAENTGPAPWAAGRVRSGDARQDTHL